MVAGFASLDTRLRGKVAEFVCFEDVLRYRLCGVDFLVELEEVRQMPAAALRNVPLVSQLLTHCRVLTMVSDSAEILEAMVWPLSILKSLRLVEIRFSKNLRLAPWEKSCARLSRSGVLKQTKLEVFRVVLPSTEGQNKLVACAEFSSLLGKLPLDGALRSAVVNGTGVPSETVKGLLDRGADVMNQPTCGYFKNTLLQAVSFQTTEVVKVFLENKAAGGGVRQQQQELLFLAARRKESVAAMTELLLANGADPLVRDRSRGRTALHYVIENVETSAGDAVKAAKLLVAADQTSVLFEDKTGHTPLNLALTRNHNREASYDPLALPGRFLTTLSDAESAQRRTAAARNKQ